MHADPNYAVIFCLSSLFTDMNYPLTDIQTDFQINRPIRYQITAIRNYFHKRQTDVAYDNKRYFFQKNKKLLKIRARYILI